MLPQGYLDIGVHMRVFFAEESVRQRMHLGSKNEFFRKREGEVIKIY